MCSYALPGLRRAWSAARDLSIDRVRDGLLVFFVRVILFGAAAAGYFVTNFVVPASVGVVAQASLTAISNVAPHAMRRGVVGQWGGTGGAICEDHLALAGSVRVAAAWS